MALKDWSTTAADNDDADASIDWSEGQAPSTVNGSARSMMAVLKKALGHIVSMDDYGATGDGVTNDTSSIQSAIDDCDDGGTVLGTKGKNYFFTNLSITKSITLDFGGASISVDPTSSGANGDPAIWFKGTLSGTSHGLNAVSIGVVDVYTTAGVDAANYTAGDYVWISDSASVAASDSAGSAYSDRGELNQVKSVSASDVILMYPVEQAYSSTPVIAKVTSMLKRPVVTGIKNCTESDPGSAYAGTLYGSAPHIIHFQYCENPRVELCTVTGWNVHAVNAHRCINPYVGGNSKFDRPTRVSDGLGYAVRFHACRTGVCENTVSYSCRHHFDHVMSFDVQSRNNKAFDIRTGAFTGHGHGSRRYTSTDDQVIGAVASSFGWQQGNSTFNADYEFKIVNPVYRGSGTAFGFYTASEDMEIVNPDVVTSGRGVDGKQGVKRLVVRGGVIDQTQLVALNQGVFINPTITSTVDCSDLDVDGVLFKFPSGIGRAVDTTRIGGCTSVRNCRISGGAAFYNADYATTAPTVVELHNNRLISGTITTFVNTASAPTKAFIATSNFCSEYTNSGIRFPEMTGLFISGNYMDPGSGGGSVNNAVTCTGTFANILAAAGANLFGNMSGTGTQRDTIRFTGTSTNPLIMRGHYIWVDATGDLRIKSSAPTTDLDGTVVGTQS